MQITSLYSFYLREHCNVSLRLRSNVCKRSISFYVTGSIIIRTCVRVNSQNNSLPELNPVGFCFCSVTLSQFPNPHKCQISDYPRTCKTSVSNLLPRDKSQRIPVLGQRSNILSRHSEDTTPASCRSLLTCWTVTRSR